MNKKIIALIIAVVVMTILGFGIWTISSKSNNDEKSNSNSKNNNLSNDNKIAVVYFSATGTTKKVAETISSETGGELIEIIPKEKYTSADLNWNDSKSRTSIECNDQKSRPEIENTINVDDFNVIYLGYPIWWGDVPHIILTFMDTYRLDGKTIIPFCTSGGTGIIQSMKTLKKYNSNVNWIDGKRLGSSENEIKSWVNNINY